MIQTNLFGDTIETLPSLVLEEPTAEQWNATTSLLENCCNKQELLTYAETFSPWFNKYSKVMRATRNGRIVEATETTQMMKSGTSKNGIAQGVALILASEQNLKQYIDTLSTEMKSLWRIVLANVFVSMRTAKRVLGVSHDLFKTDRYSYYYSNSFVWNSREYGWFSATDCFGDKPDRWGYRGKEKYITVNCFVRKLFFHHFFPEASESDVSLTELPEGEWHTINLESDSISNYNLFCGLYQQGEFYLKKKGISASDIKQAQKKMMLTELFPGDDNEYRRNLRVHNYLQLLSLNESCKLIDRKMQKKATIVPYEDTLRDIIANFSHFGHYLPAMLFPHVKGLRKQMTDYGRETKLAEMLFSWLREEPERWISINDLLLKIMDLESDGTTSRYSILVYHPNDEIPSSPLLNEYSGRSITAEHYTQEFGYTALQGLALMLCSLGIAEVALRDDIHRHLSPFDSIDYVRLTDLGRYALGITDEYIAPEQEHVAYFELDPERLIIRSLVEPNPYAQLLTDTSVAISRNRFETSALSFLANCHTKADVESKISIFRQFISSDLPPLWEQFFQQLLRHCHPLKEDKTGYKRYVLDPSNRDLIQLVTTDPVLRQVVIRAEGYRIMVKNDDLNKFENQLKKHGYLL